MKKVWKFLGSMQFAILLLVILAAACAGGSFIAQGKSYEWYAEAYSPRTAGLILAFRLDDVFHSWWFLLLTAFLCGNLLLCNLTRLPQLLARSRAASDPARLSSGPVSAERSGVADPAPVFAALHMPKMAETTDGEGRRLLYSVKNVIGLWGAWVCHLGILLLIVGFTLGQLTKEEYTVYGVPGQIKQIGDTDYALGIHGFEISYLDDGSVDQYTAQVTVYDLSDPDDPLGEDATVSVNNPGRCFGFKLYQNSTGQAARLQVRRDGELMEECVLCVGEGAFVMGTSLSVLLQRYLPEYDLDENGNPVGGYAYLIYIGEQMYTMSVQREGEIIPDLQPYEVSFSEPQNYTLIQIKRDRFTWLALAGGLLTMLGLVLAFYLQTKKLWAVQEADGSWTLRCHSPKAGALLAEQFAEALPPEIKKEVPDDAES